MAMLNDTAGSGDLEYLARPCNGGEIIGARFWNEQYVGKLSAKKSKGKLQIMDNLLILTFC